MNLNKHASLTERIKSQDPFDKEAAYVRRFPSDMTPPRSLEHRNKVLSIATRSYLLLRSEPKSISVINVTQDSERIFWNDDGICNVAILHITTGKMEPNDEQ